MKNKFYITAIASLLMLASPRAWAQTTPSNENFQAGEVLTYVCYYGFIDGGYANISLSDKTYNGKKCQHVKVVGGTSGLAEKLFGVYDVYESYFDPETYQPLVSVRNVKEGRYKAYNEITYDMVKRSINSKKSGVKPMSPKVKDNIYDVLSAFYYLRRGHMKNLKPGDIISLDSYFDEDYWPLQVKFKGISKVKTKLGTIECLVFNPMVEQGKIFKAKDDLTLWISNDKNFIPIRAQMEMVVGSFKIDLVSYTGLKNEIPIIQKQK